MLGLQRTTADYLVLEETKEIATSLKVIKRAAVYEENARISDKKLVKECILEIEKEKEMVGEWERKRNNCWAKMNFKKEEINKIRKEEDSVALELYNRW